MSRLRVGSRKSPLALWQAHFVANKLKEKGLKVEICTFSTHAERTPHAPFETLGVQGVFTKVLEDALRTQCIDLAVHSAKDVPASISSVFQLLAYTKRVRAHDVFVTKKGQYLDLSAKDLRVGTSSPRRTAQLSYYFPNFRVLPVRGNIHTRLQYLENGEYDALILAYAALSRIQYTSWIAHTLREEYFVPAVGQGSMAVEGLALLSKETKQVVRSVLNDPMTELCLHTERVFLKNFGGGCYSSTFGLAKVRNNQLALQAGTFYMKKLFQVQESMPIASLHAIDTANQLGKATAEKLLYHLSHHKYT